MRVVAEIAHHQAHISIFSFNLKYLIKIERGPLEQTYKISQLDYLIPDLEAVKRLAEERFLPLALEVFALMEEGFGKAMEDF
jgi:hypothetical protein